MDAFTPSFVTQNVVHQLMSQIAQCFSFINPLKHCLLAKALPISGLRSPILLTQLSVYGHTLLYYTAHFGSPGSAIAPTHCAFPKSLERMGKKSASPMAPHFIIPFLPPCRAKSLYYVTLLQSIKSMI